MKKHPRALRTPQRFQLTKHALTVVEGGHPWIFRDQLSSAAAALADGQWVALYDPQNRVVGYGIYQAEGAVGIRVLARGPDRPTAASLGATIDIALAKRKPLADYTDAVRALHGENDGIPGVVVDVFAGCAVVQAYAPGTRALARWAGGRVAERLGLTTVVEKPPKRGKGGGEHPRLLRGAAIPDVVRFREGTLALSASPGSGQKSGSFLDLRGLRRDLAERDLAGARVLDLFAYTGGNGLACERAGATSILHVDASEDALLFGEAHHTLDPAKHSWLEADIFEWLPAFDRHEKFDVVIVDPPSMTSNMDQVPRVLAAYKKLYTQTKSHVTDGGLLVACCCTSRVNRGSFRKTVGDALGGGFALERELTPEIDHPVGFPQADYLKILIFRSRRASGRAPARPDSV
jgi:23S rRNA G2069 N7-methylase RlmK/C1962 C5-methylase RlmI